MEGSQFFDYSEQRATAETVARLKEAMIYIQETSINWKSPGEETNYGAWPVDIDVLEDDLEKLPYTPETVIDAVMNCWGFQRVTTNCGREKPVIVERFIIGAGQLLMKAACEYDPYDPDFSKDAVYMVMNRQLRLGGPKVVTEDYADIDNALFDLNALTQPGREELVQLKQTMTDEAKSLERMVQLDIVGREKDKTKGPGWWVLEDGQFRCAIRASSPGEAAQRLEAYYGRELDRGICSKIYITRREDAGSAAFDAQFSPDMVIRLIPYSEVPWPEDIANLTPEQAAAFDEHHRVRSTVKGWIDKAHFRD